MSFIFAVLGSIIFWIIYFAITVFAGTMLFRYLMPKMYKMIISRYTVKEIIGEVGDNFIVYIVCIISVYFLWPVLLFLVIIKFIFKIFSKIIWKAFVNSIISADDCIPEITFKVKDSNDNENTLKNNKEEFPR